MLNYFNRVFVGLNARLLAGLLIACIALLAVAHSHAQNLQTIPALSARVIDNTGTLSAAQAQALEAKLAAFEKARGTQVVVLMLNSTLPEDIADYTQRVGDAWKIGRNTVGDGVLLVVAKDDRRVRIATSKTLEGAIPDLAAQQIIDRVITPQFRLGDFAAGINAGVDQLMGRISGENLPLPEASPAGQSSDSSFQWENFAVFLFIAVPVAGRILADLIGRKAGAVVTGVGVGLVAWIVTASLLLGGVVALASMLFALIASLAPAGRSSGLPGSVSSAGHGGGSDGNGFGGGGGGFSSGGGGDFGGGGASGRW